jgi:hypothetical protein
MQKFGFLFENDATRFGGVVVTGCVVVSSEGDNVRTPRHSEAATTNPL